MKVKAIETVYRGWRFRSRLEARWAVFMDHAGVQFEYEPEGYETSAGRYLPDFWLADLGLWLEVKPRIELISEYDWKRVVAFQGGDNRIVVLTGQPWLDAYRFHMPIGGHPYQMAFRWLTCQRCSQVRIDIPIRAECCCVCDARGDAATTTPHDWEGCKTRLAFAAARRARFEHGETP